MLARWIFWSAVTAGSLAMLAMVAITGVWMSVPTRIVYQESSRVRTEVSPVEVREHAQSYFLTTDQKHTLDLVRSGTPIVWFGGFGIAFFSTVIGAAAWLKMKNPP